MATVVEKANPANFQESAATQNFPPADWLRNPAGFDVLHGSVEPKYWKLISGNTDIGEMTAPEKASVDAAIDAKIQSDTRKNVTNRIEGQMPLGVTDRAVVQAYNKQDNYILTRLLELQLALNTMKASTGNVDNLRAAIPSNWSNTKLRQLGNAVKDYKDDINSGISDDPVVPSVVGVV